jgi:hypothetical protein
MPSWNIQESQQKLMSVSLHNSFSSSNLSHNVDNGGGSCLAVAVAAWRQLCSSSGGSVVAVAVAAA